MKTSTSVFFRFAAAVFAAGLLCSCESDDVKDKIDDKIEDAKDRAGLNDKDEGNNVSGVWSGHSGSGQWYSVMTLTESDGRIRGSMSWVHNNDTRSVSGSRSGKSVTLHIGGGDVWHLTVKGDRMSGSGDKYGTDRSYALSYTR